MVRGSVRSGERESGWGEAMVAELGATENLDDTIMNMIWRKRDRGVSLKFKTHIEQVLHSCKALGEPGIAPAFGLLRY